MTTQESKFDQKYSSLIPQTSQLETKLEVLTKSKKELISRLDALEGIEAAAKIAAIQSQLEQLKAQIKQRDEKKE